MKDKNISFLVTFVPSINLTAAFIIDRWKIIVQKFVGFANYHSWRRYLYIKWVFAITGKITWKLQSKTPLQRHFTLEPSWVRIPPTEKVLNGPSKAYSSVVLILSRNQIELLQKIHVKIIQLLSCEGIRTHALLNMSLMSLQLSRGSRLIEKPLCLHGAKGFCLMCKCNIF